VMYRHNIVETPPPLPTPQDSAEWSWDEPFLPKIFKHFDSRHETKLRVLDKLHEELTKLEYLGIWTPSSGTSRPPEPHIAFPYHPPGLALITAPKTSNNQPPYTSSHPSQFLSDPSISTSPQDWSTRVSQGPSATRHPDGPSTLLEAADVLGNVFGVEHSNVPKNSPLQYAGDIMHWRPV